MENHPLDLVGKLGFNSLNPMSYMTSILWSWTLMREPRQEIGWSGSNHTLYDKQKRRSLGAGLLLGLVR